MDEQRRDDTQRGRVPPGTQFAVEEPGDHRGLHAEHIDHRLLHQRVQAGVNQQQKQADQADADGHEGGVRRSFRPVRDDGAFQAVSL
jgi:hypothetical protein